MFVICPVMYLSTCSYISEKRNTAFDSINVGDTEANVISKFGMPSVREKQGVLFRRYAITACQNPCVERLWFENGLTLYIEAWSVELGKDGRVIDKAHWVST